MVRILGSYLKREQENITEANPSVKQEVGKIVIKSKPANFPMSQEASKQHNESHNTRNLMLHNGNKPQMWIQLMECRSARSDNIFGQTGKRYILYRTAKGKQEFASKISLHSR